MFGWRIERGIPEEVPIAPASTKGITYRLKKPEEWEFIPIWNIWIPKLEEVGVHLFECGTVEAVKNAVKDGVTPIRLTTDLAESSYHINAVGLLQEAEYHYDPRADVWIEQHSQPKEPELQGIDATLAERGSRYGEYHNHARITQNIKAAMQDSPNWRTLPDFIKEFLDMTAHKVGRILNGDPMYVDNVHDIVGYAKLTEERMLHLNTNPAKVIGDEEAYVRDPSIR